MPDKDTQGPRPDNGDEAASRRSSKLTYRLVVIMLITLAALVVLIVSLPLLAIPVLGRTSQDAVQFASSLAEYSKWTIAVLLGAFGAWIGAGAAYFFGKENLQESSQSTENALRIQQEGLRRSPLMERIKDMNLTAMNSKFFFNLKKTKDDVARGLDECRGYWFVPIVDEITGALQDIIHARAFWSPTPAGGATIQDTIAELDKTDAGKRLHGDLFFTKVTANDKVRDAYDLITKKGVEVAIVVDDKGKPTHCLSKTDLWTLLKLTDSK